MEAWEDMPEYRPTRGGMMVEALFCFLIWVFLLVLDKVKPAVY